LKLAVSPSFVNKNLSKELFIAGYVSGSTRGSAATLLCYMLTQMRLAPWEVPEVKSFMMSVARLKATFVVYEDGQQRAIDAWRALSLVWEWCCDRDIIQMCCSTTVRNNSVTGHSCPTVVLGNCH
jgi:hypothetical protein